MAYAQSDFEYYLFGVKLGSLQETNWFEIAAGLTASVLTHELGHVLYLELAGKSWDARYSFPSEVAIHTDDSLTGGEAVNFGRAGFVLQTALGTRFSCTRCFSYGAAETAQPARGKVTACTEESVTS